MRKILIIAVILLVTASTSAEKRWEFHPAPPDSHVSGPKFWMAGKTAQFDVKCVRNPQDIRLDPRGARFPPILSPRRLVVTIAWRNSVILSAIIVGTAHDPRARTLANIFTRIDDRPVETEKWATNFGSRHFIEDDKAVSFLQRLLPPAERLTVKSDFTDGITRTETFDLAGIGAMLELMESDCAAIRPLLEDNE